MKRMLNIDPVVKVNVQVGTSSAASGVFDVGAIIGPTSVTGKLDTTHRFQTYGSLAEMAADGIQSSSPEYLAAQKYFNVSPAPASVVIIFYDTAENTTDSPTAAMLDAIDKGAEFYAVYYIPKTSETAANIKTNIVALASALDSLNRGVLFYGVTGEVSAVIVDNGIFATLAGSGSKRAVGMYCASAENDAAGLMGEAMGLALQNANSAFALCYKSVASATKADVTQTQVASLQALNANVLVQRTKTRAYIEKGATASGLRFDDVLYLDRIAYEIQQAIYEMIANSATKLPQDDSTTLAFLSEIGGILDNYYNMGVLAESPWRGSAIGGLETGDIVEHGHNEFADSFDNQTTADRAAHKAMPITVLVCMSGSVESIVITVDVQT